MMEEDFLPRPKPARKLEELGVEELRDRIAALQVEIDACQAMLNKKSAEKAAADALFSRKT